MREALSNLDKWPGHFVLFFFSPPVPLYPHFQVQIQGVDASSPHKSTVL